MIRCTARSVMPTLRAISRDALLGVAHDAHEHVGVVAEDRPLGATGRRLVLRCFGHMGPA